MYILFGETITMIMSWLYLIWFTISNIVTKINQYIHETSTHQKKYKIQLHVFLTDAKKDNPHEEKKNG